MKHWYNTIDAPEKAEEEHTGMAATQEDIIIRYFMQHPDKKFTPYEVWVNIGGKNNWPITSVRRAMTNLTEQGRLVKYGEKRRGGYGTDNYTWGLPQKEGQLEIF